MMDSPITILKNMLLERGLTIKSFNRIAKVNNIGRLMDGVIGVSKSDSIKISFALGTPDLYWNELHKKHIIDTLKSKNGIRVILGFTIIGHHITLPIKGYNGLYYVSTNGLIFSFSKKKGGAILRTTFSNCGYPCVMVYNNGKQKIINIHRAVAECFVKNPNNLPIVNHKDGNKSNSHYSNLEWCTQSYNAKHAVDNGIKVSPRGDGHYKSKLTDTQILEIRSSKERQCVLAKKYNVSRKYIWAIVRNYSRK